MNALIKNALMTTGIVLASIFVMRQLKFTKTIVDNALNG